MPQISIVRAGRVVEAHRWDADYYTPECLRLESQLTSHPDFCYLGDILNMSESCYGVLPKSAEYLAPDDERSSLFLCRGEDVRRNCLSYDSWVKVPEKYRFARCQVRQGDLLILVKGKTIDSDDGVAWISETLPRSIFNGSVFRVSLRRGDPRFFYALFRTRFFTAQKRRFIANATVEYNAIGQIKRYMVICPSPEKQAPISELVGKYFALLRQSRESYRAASEILQSELSLNIAQFNRPVAYTSSLSEVESSRRLDPEHFFPAFKSLAGQLPRRVKLVKLGPRLSFCQRGKQPLYGKAGLSVINSKHVQPNRILVNGNRKAMASSANDLQIRHGDLLVTGTGRGTLGRAAAYLESQRALPDNHVTILRTSNFDPVYLAFFINSLLGQLQVESLQRGTSGQLELYPADLRKLLVWDASLEIQREIRRLHDDARDAEASANDLLAVAKASIESLIEEAR